MAFDLIIRGGTVVDGTGAPPVTADVAVDGDRLAEVGRVAGRARRALAAAGLGIDEVVLRLPSAGRDVALAALDELTRFLT